jgi:hypothetical protein
MLKILYSAGNRIGSYYQLKRFLQSIQHKNYNIKIAAFKKSLGDLDADYMLDSLLNFTNPEEISFNGNYTYYSNEIKRFAPDLIISDFEIYTSTIALELNIKLWQFSPINFYYAMNNDVKYNLGIHKNYFHLLDSSPKRNGYILNLLNNSNRRFVLSHICDSQYNNIISNNYEWARPSFILGYGNKKIDYFLALLKSNKNIINELKNKNSILFSPYMNESFDDLKIEDISKDSIYEQYIENCKYFVSDGTAVFAADAFYNQKYNITYPRYDDIESIIISMVNRHYNFGCISDNFTQSNKIEIELNEKVKFISEYLGEL